MSATWPRRCSMTTKTSWLITGLPSHNPRLSQDLKDPVRNLGGLPIDHGGPPSRLGLEHPLDREGAARIDLAGGLRFDSGGLHGLAHLAHRDVARRLLGGLDPQDGGKPHLHPRHKPSGVFLADRGGPRLQGDAGDIAYIRKAEALRA